LLLKILLENGQKPSLFSFYSPIQNLLGIWSWSLNNCKLNLFENFLENKNGEPFSHLNGPRFPFGSLAKAAQFFSPARACAPA
jgi:hypothetical protein